MEQPVEENRTEGGFTHLGGRTDAELDFSYREIRAGTGARTKAERWKRSIKKKERTSLLYVLFLYLSFDEFPNHILYLIIFV